MAGNQKSSKRKAPDDDEVEIPAKIQKQIYHIWNLLKMQLKEKQART